MSTADMPITQATVLAELGRLGRLPRRLARHRTVKDGRPPSRTRSRKALRPAHPRGRHVP
jgi:hypothetical protein